MLLFGNIYLFHVQTILLTFIVMFEEKKSVSAYSKQKRIGSDVILTAGHFRFEEPIFPPEMPSHRKSVTRRLRISCFYRDQCHTGIS